MWRTRLRASWPHWLLERCRDVRGVATPQDLSTPLFTRFRLGGAHCEAGREQERLRPLSRLEFVGTQDLLARLLPPSPLGTPLRCARCGDISRQVAEL